jgi:hypothetical protein
MIDTLKLAKRLQQGNLSPEQSEVIAEALAEAEANYLTRSGLKAVTELRAEFRTGLATLKNEVLYWVVGSIGLGVLINHFWK